MSRHQTLVVPVASLAGFLAGWLAGLAWLLGYCHIVGGLIVHALVAWLVHWLRRLVGGLG